MPPPPLDKSAVITPTGKVSDFELKVACHLWDLTCATFDILNHKTIDPSALDYLAPDFTSTTELSDHPAQDRQDRDTHLAHVHEWIAQNPGLFCKILNGSVKLGNNNRRATVWLTNVLGITGLKGLQRESVTILEWEKRAEGWRCYSTRSLRGSGYLPDVVL